MGGEDGRGGGGRRCDAGRGSTTSASLFATPEVAHERRPDGSMVLRSPAELEPCRAARRVLERWAAAEPDRVFIAERDPAGGWRHHHLREASRAANAVAQSLLDRGLGPDRPVHDPGRQRHRSCADDAGRHACGRAGGAGIDGLRAAEPGLRQAALHLRPGRAGPDLRRRGGPLCQGAGDHRRDARVEIVASRGSLGAAG